MNLLKAVDLDGQFSDAPLALADIYEREGNMEKAAEVYVALQEWGPSGNSICLSVL